MKKKFINGLLLAALVGGFTSSMVSCKDYNDEKVVDLYGIVADKEASLQAAINAQVAALQAQIAALDAKIPEACKCNIDLLKAELDGKYATLTQFNALKQVVDNLDDKFTTPEEVDLAIRSALASYYTNAQIDAMLADLYANVQSLVNTNIATVNGRIDALQAATDQKLADITAELNNYVKKESLAQAIAELLGSSKTSLEEVLQEFLEKNSTGIDEDAVKLLIESNEIVLKAKADAEAALALAQTNAALITGIDGRLTTVEGKVSTLEGQVSTLEGKVSTLENDFANINNVVIPALQQSITTLEANVVSLGDKVDQAAAVAAEAKAKAEANALLLAALQNNYSELNAKVETLEGDISVVKQDLSEAASKIDALEEKVKADEAQAAALHAQMLETISGLASQVSENTEKIGELQDAFAVAFATMQDNVMTLLEAILALNDAILEFALEVDNVLAKYITSIEVNGTNNPLFGGFSLPFDVRSNVLVAFHGMTSDNGLRFPTNDPDFYALPDAEQWNLITDEDIAMIGDLSKVKGYVRAGAGKVLMAKDGAAGNAGTLYLTVNPTNRDFTGTEFTLINSQNEESAVKLENIKKSDKTLYFGYTRGAFEGEQSANGFYEAQATFKAEDLENGHSRLHYDLASIKEVVSDIKNYKNGINLMDMAQTIYNNVSEVLEANAVKATWNDGEDEEDAKSVVSQYSIAATTVKPLSFAFAKEIKFDKVPGLGTIENFVSQLVGKINIAMPEMKKIKFTISQIDIPEFDQTDVKWRIHIYEPLNVIASGNASFNVTLPSYTFVDNDGVEHILYPDTNPVTGNATVSVNTEGNYIDITYDLGGLIYELYGDITDPISKVNDILQQIDGFVDDINDYLEEVSNISIDGIADNVMNQVHKYINAINKRFAKYLNPNQYLQPIMLVQTESSYARLSQKANYPSHIFGATHLVLAPTNYNAEILSPAYKKFIAVTNVSKEGVSAKGGDAACKAELDRANAQANFCEVIDGGFSEFLDFSANTGYTYEILYSAVDYHGLVVSKKFYVAVD